MHVFLHTSPVGYSLPLTKADTFRHMEFLGHSRWLLLGNCCRVSRAPEAACQARDFSNCSQRSTERTVVKRPTDFRYSFHVPTARASAACAVVADQSAGCGGAVRSRRDRRRIGRLHGRGGRPVRPTCRFPGEVHDPRAQRLSFGTVSQRRGPRQLGTVPAVFRRRLHFPGQSFAAPPPRPAIGRGLVGRLPAA